MLDLFRVVVAESTEEEDDSETKEHMDVTIDDREFELSTPPDLMQLGTTAGRKLITEDWLDAYTKHLGKQFFSTVAFINHAQQKIDVLQSMDDAPSGVYEFSTEIYEHVKDWIVMLIDNPQSSVRLLVQSQITCRKDLVQMKGSGSCC